MPKHHGLRALLSRWGWGLTLISLCAIAAPASATMVFQRGIAGPVVVHDDKVYFAQADETVTVLDLKTGRVLHRLTDRPEVNRVEACDAGLIAMGYRRVALLDWDSLEEVWSRASDESFPYVLAKRPGQVAIRDGASVFAVDSATGEEKWSVPGWCVHHMAEGDRLMYVIRKRADANHPGSREIDTVYLIEQETGKVLRKHRFELEDRIDSNYVTVDGELFVIRFDYQSGDMTVWRIDTQGRRVALAPDDDAEFIGSPEPLYVRIGGKHFDHGGILVAEAITQPDAANQPRVIHAEDGLSVFDASNALHQEKQARLRIEDHGKMLRLVVPHLSGSSVSGVAVTDTLILLSTYRGQVECLNRATGRSRWLYVSPWSYGFASFSGGNFFNYSELISEFDQEKTAKDKRTPSRVVPLGKDWADADPPPKDAAVIEDPSPMDPYAELRDLLLAMRVLPAVVGGLAMLWWFGSLRGMKKNRARWVAMACAISCVLIAPVLMFFGALSVYGTAALMVEMIVLAGIAVVFAYRAVRQGQGVALPVTALLFIAASTWWAWPAYRWVGHVLTG